MTMPHAEPADRLADTMLGDRRRLRRRLDAAGRIRDHAARQAALAGIEADIEAARQRYARRRAGVPKVTYPEALPVSQKRDELRDAIRDHQVVIVAGETGSGKTTQLPKICLELGRGVAGMIGHTQPRRLAARTVADRIAQELGTPLGGAVGYQVRFTARVGDETLVKLMTDGILLAELPQDRLLLRYDTLIIDEAHERSLNIDFILGYLRQLLPRRPDLKVVITSATIDPQRFARHFAGPGGDAPVIEVSGRTYPVQVRYRPVCTEDNPDQDQTQAILDAVDELCAEGPGDILVFLSGEREIRDTADALNRRNLPGTEVLPLYARLSAAEQHRVFAGHTGRRVVLATNVAETSLTVPGIRYVVDPGTARISRYSHRLKVQRLPIEPISQASANQRAGRCGRTSDGICIRLYTEEDFLARPEFTEPEILRTNLASVILQMTAIGLGDVAAFPFIDPPDRRNIKDGLDLLVELGALTAGPAPAGPAPADGGRMDGGRMDGGRTGGGRPGQSGGPGRPDRLTPLGRQLATLPIDPRLGRMVLAAQDNGCVREVLIVAAALSIQDPRERPAEHQQAATEVHARFADPESDVIAYLNLWNYLQEQHKALTGNQFRRLCRTEFLNYLRVREWQDLHAQLRQVARTLGVAASAAPAPAERVHQAVLAGLLSHVGLKDPAKPEYLGARNARFAIFPGSALARKPPRWVMAAELVETSRLWARVCARIEPEWVEALAGHLVRRSYSEPHWERKQGAVLGYERVTLYGIPLVANRKVNFARVDPALSRELFIRHALVEGDWTTSHRFFHDNRKLLDEVQELEHRTRRRDLVVDDAALFDFYDRRIPADVVSARHFDTWWKRAGRQQPDLLTFDRAMLVNPAGAGARPEDYPDEWVAGELRLPLTYRFEPGTGTDGVTVHIPLPLLGQVGVDGFDWQIPGLREELVVALIRSLPKPVRRNFVPVPDVARAVLAQIAPAQGPLLPALERALLRMTGVAVPADAWDYAKVPDHLRLTFQIEDEHGVAVATGKDLAALQQQLRVRARAALADTLAGIGRSGLREFPAEGIPRVVERRHDGFAVRAYPALVDEGGTAGVELFESPAEASRAMAAGTRRLLLLGAPAPARLLEAPRPARPVAPGRPGDRRPRPGLSTQDKLILARNPHGGLAALLDDCAGAAVDHLVAEAGGPAWEPAGFARLREAVGTRLAPALFAVVDLVRQTLDPWYPLRQRLATGALPAHADLRDQLARLVYPGFVTATGWAHLADLPRYLRAMTRRLDKLGENPARDQELMRRVQEIEQEYRDLAAGLPPSPELDRIRWMIEELRVSYFAQALGTRYPVSDKRIFTALDELACQT